MASEKEEAALAQLQATVEELIAKGDVSTLLNELAKTQTVGAKNATYVPATIADCLATIIENIPSNKYIFSILITACLKKIVDPKQDVRVGQDNMPGGYSNRSLDQRIVTPFLKRYNYTHCEASGLESGRNFERPLPWDLEYPSNPRGRGNREAFLGTLNFIENGGNPSSVILYMLYLDASQRQTREAVQSAPLEESVAKISKVLERHFSEGTGQGKSRLPVLAIYSVYDCVTKELKRYEGLELLPLERHTTADLRSGSIGDIQINRENLPFEGVEVKSEKPITADMIRELVRKFNGSPISRYYVLTTFKGIFKEEDEESIVEAVKETEAITGCQIIVDDLTDTVRYYLRLLSNPSRALEVYSVLLNSDPDIRPELVSAWNRIIGEEYPDRA
jgi:DNA (cytosine-5)-methyltransferase 1